MDPPVLLMDEPTASLDPARREELAATLRGVAAGGTTLVIATHDAEFVRSCAQRVLLMEEGTIVREAASSERLS
jgi:ABC-type polar amino acid transport system ATPase subunit